MNILLTLKTIRDLPDKIFDETINRKQGGIVESQFGLDSRQRDRRRGGVGRKASHLRRGRAHGGAARPRARRVRSDLAAESAPRATAPHNTSAGTTRPPAPAALPARGCTVAGAGACTQHAPSLAPTRLRTLRVLIAASRLRLVASNETLPSPHTSSMRNAR